MALTLNQAAPDDRQSRAAPRRAFPRVRFFVTKAVAPRTAWSPSTTSAAYASNDEVERPCSIGIYVPEA
jgi:hypothetical protein